MSFTQKKRNIVINIKRENNINDLKSILDENIQLELSISIANFFNNKDITTICEEALSMNFRPKREITIEENTIYKYHKTNNRELEIKDILLLNHYPPVRYIEVITRLNPKLDYNRFKYTFNPNIYGILNKVLTDAYNFNTYCLSSLTTYTVDKSLLYKNFSKEVAKILGNDRTIIIDFKYIINSLLEHKLFTNKDRFIKVFNVSYDIQVEVTTVTNTIIKLSINNKKDRRYIFLDRHLKGLGQLRLLFELITKELCP